jgi:hypothetical protein
MAREYNLSEQGRRKIVETILRLNSDPEFAAKRSEAASRELKRRHADPNYKPAKGKRWAGSK